MGVTDAQQTLLLAFLLCVAVGFALRMIRRKSQP